MPLGFVLLTLAVVAVIAVVAVGRGDALPDPVVDRAPLGLPDGPLDAQALEHLRFSLGFRGYRMDQVDEVLDRLAGELGARDERIAHLEGQLEEQRQERVAAAARPGADRSSAALPSSAPEA